MSLPNGIYQVDVGDASPDNGFLITEKAAKWLASWLEEACNCGLFKDHMECIGNIEAIIYLFKQE